MTTSPLALANDVEYCRARPAFYNAKDKRYKGKTAQCKLNLRITEPSLQEYVIDIMKAAGATRKIGPAPRGAMEREAQKLLDRLR